MLLGLIGNPDNRRIKFAEVSARNLGMQCRVFAWQDCPDWIDELAYCDLLKIDAAGEDERVQQQLLSLGGWRGARDSAQRADVRADVRSDVRANGIEHGEITALSEAHRGFCQQLDKLQSSGLRFMNSPNAIKTMFDKWSCHQRFVAAGISRPDSFLAPDNVDAFLEQIQQRQAGRLFLKPLHGSSGSGVLAFRWLNDKLQIIAPIELSRNDKQAPKFYNSLRIKSYLKLADVKAILAHVLPHGVIAEQWLPKVQLNNLNVDVRVVVIAGKACHFIARKSPYPMTNLHLGSERVSEEDFITAFGLSAATACRRMAERAATCFPDALYSGVDVMITPNMKPVVLEINAFGDLLPNVLHEGKSTYTCILQAAKDHARTAV